MGPGRRWHWPCQRGKGCIGVPVGSPYNVAQLYAKFGEAIRGGVTMHPGFDAAVTRHRLLDKVVRAARSGQKQ